MSGARPSERAEPWLTTADRGRDPAQPARLPAVPARESSPVTRKYWRITAQANTDRPCAVARVVTNRMQRSDRAIALRWRPARMCWIDGLSIMAEVLENPLDDGGFLDTGDHPQLPAAVSAGLNGDGKHPLEPLRPAHRPLPIDGRWLIRLHSLAGSRRTRA